MKTTLILLLGFFGLSVVAQSQNTPNTAPPNFAPKAPESAAFLQHGAYPVDLSTGVTSISIPLYTIETGDFQLPIKLDYHASGIKVDQEATWVGLGWNLSFGAQLILSPRGEIDEGDGQINNVPTQQDFDDYFALNPYSESAPTGVFGMTDVDRLKDVFMFSSPTANGSFYYHNGEAIVFPPDAFKVLENPEGTLLGGINIADAYGNTYVLGAKEESLREFSHSDYYYSAWYVTKILTAKGNTIVFKYYDEDDKFKTGSIVQQIDVNQYRINCNCLGQESNDDPLVEQIRTNEGEITTESKKIKEIIFNNGASKILFTKINDREDQVHRSENGYLSKIEVMNKDNGVQFNTVKNYLFDYDYFNPNIDNYKAKRLKLLSITSVNEIEDAPYTFVYSDLAVPYKNSFSQDFYGYHNGAHNFNLIPKQQISNPPVVVGSANREVNSNYNQAGILKEVHYPTKGWTKFNYETNQTYGSVPGATSAEVCVVEGQVHGAGDRNPAPQDIDQCTSTIFGTGTLTVTYYVDNLIDRIDNTVNKYHFAQLRIRGADGDYVINDGKKFGMIPPNTFSVSMRINQADGIYTIIGEAYGDTMRLEITSITLTSSEPIYKNIDGPGIRIGSIENFDQNDKLVLKKAYDYSQPEHREKSSGLFVNENVLKFISNSVTRLSIHQCPSEGGEGGYNFNTGADVTTNYYVSSRSKYNTEGNSIIYKNVKERNISTVDSTSNGFTQYTFSTEGDWVRPDMNASIITTWKRGKILNKKVYKSVNNVDYLLREETNDYVEDTSKVSYIKGFKIIWHKSINSISDEPTRHTFAGCGGPYHTSEAFVTLFQNHPVYWNYLKKTVVEERFYNSANVLTNSLYTAKIYDYNNPNHLQLSSETVITSDDQDLVTQYFYPHDTEVALEPYVEGAGGLIARNMIGIPLLTKTLKGNLVLSEQKTEYASFARVVTPDPRDYATSLLPKFVYAKKGTNPFERKISYDYDEFGNIREYLPENGVPVSIVWGYNKTKPVAKIENAVYAGLNPSYIDAIETSSNSGNNQLLQSDLKALRTSMPNSMVTSYTYVPLVGVKTITDVKGDTNEYFYDTEGRLITVKDADGNILSNTKYHYKD